MKFELCYCDSVVFLGWFNEEEDKIEKCKSLFESAEDGDIRIVTSAITLTEVIKLKGYDRLKQEDEEKIKRFFENEYIVVRNVDRNIAENARHLIWSHAKLKPKDSIHVATAIKEKTPKLFTFDRELIELDGKIGNPPLRISKPDIIRQGELFENEEASKD